jgi:hypothetical protein
LSNVIPVINSRRMRWVGHVAQLGEMRNGYYILVRMGFREIGWEGVSGCIWFRIELGTGFCEHDNEPCGSIRCGEFFD